MLSINESKFLVLLTENYQGKGYITLDWNDIFLLLGDEAPDRDICLQMWEQLRLNNCLIIKFKDENEVCFTLTDKAKLLAQEFIAISDHAEEQNAVLQQDSLGRTVMVLPKSSDLSNAIKIARKSTSKGLSKIGSFFSGLFGGLLGGLISGGAIYYFLQAIIG